MRIHKAKSVCGRASVLQQRTRSNLGETQEDSSQDQHHSATNLPASEQSPGPSQISESEHNDAPLDDQQDLQDEEITTFVTTEPDPTNSPNVHEAPDRIPPCQQEIENTKQRIMWPKTADEKTWKDFDFEVSLLLENTLQGPAERKLKSMSHLIYTIGKERIGVAEQWKRLKR